MAKLYILPIFSLFFVHVNSQNRATLYASNLYGPTECTEPEHRFTNTVADKLPHNTEFINKPEQWLCQFCDADLMSIVKRVCCGETARKRRETQDIQFWHNISQNSSIKRTHKVEHHLNFHPNVIIEKQLTEDCLDDKDKKAHKRVKRGNWDRSIRNGGKGRSTYQDKMDEIGCKKSISTEFLNFEGNTPNRAKYKHTYIQHECCGVGIGGKDSCDYQEVKSTYLFEECCQEGCRFEEIYEDCGAWRWSLKEQFRN